MRLFVSESKKVIFSIPYIIFVIALFFFNYTQYQQDFEVISKPQPGLDDYGYTQKEIPEVIMPAAIENLQAEYVNNTYVAYPFGFYKQVHLNEEEQQDMRTILETLSLKNSYKAFLKKMKKVDQVIGGGSSYNEKYLVSTFGTVPKTYEDTLQEYNVIKTKDQFSGAYARLFVDYLGIILALIPVFIAVTVSLKDQMNGAEDLIYSRAISSVHLIGTRYIAMITAMFAPVLVLALYETYRVYELYPNENLNPFAFLTYSVGWLLPTILFVTALGFALTEWTGTPIAIAIQFVLFFISLYVGLMQMGGGYGNFMLAVRHNELGNTQAFLDNVDTLLVNRLTYVVLAISLVLLTVWIYEKKRKGMRTGYAWLKQLFQNHRA